MSSWVIYALELASTGEKVNAYVEDFDPDAFDGRGDAHLTDDPGKALRFDTMPEAIEFWRQASTVRPVRADGEPNRPLSAFTCNFRRLS